MQIGQLHFFPAEFFEDCDASETSKGKPCSNLYAALLLRRPEGDTPGTSSLKMDASLKSRRDF
jgi:hypothetical protein